jgi:hypothetical protein
MNRSCQRQMQVFDLPVAALIAIVPSPSSIIAQQNDTSTPDMFLQASGSGHNRL